MQPASPNIAGLLQARLPSRLHQLLQRAGALLAGEGMAAYSVGGVVRDVLLDRPVALDLDIAVIGNGVEAARLLAADWGRAVDARSQFDTATIGLPGGLHVDLITARRERYRAPGALPDVEPTTDLTEDLRRRDFTVNAMAVHLSPASWGRLEDPFGGRADLAVGLIRVLHPASFGDDPTRMVRGVRYAVRLGFRLEPETHALLRHHAGDLAAISGPRRWGELRRCLHEPAPERLLYDLQAEGLLHRLHPALAFDAPARARFGRLAADRYGNRLSLPSLLSLLLWDETAEAVEALVADLRPPGEVIATLRGLPALREIEAWLGDRSTTPGAVTRRLDPYPLPAVSAAGYAYQDPLARARARMYTAVWRLIRPRLKGDDLMTLGVERGPAVGRYLDGLREARLQAVTASADDERWLVRDWLAHGGPPAG